MKAFVVDVASVPDKATWRRVRIPAELTLGDLHLAIQAVMGWTDALPHRFSVQGKPQTDGQRLESIFIKLDAAIDYDYGGRALTVTATGLEAQKVRTNSDFACLAADASVDVDVVTKRLRGVFFTISYHADRPLDFDDWQNAEKRALFEQAVLLHLKNRFSGQRGDLLTLHARLQTEVEREVGATLPTEERSIAIDRLVAIAAGDASLPVEQAVAARLAADNAKARNKRRRKR